MTASAGNVHKEGNVTNENGLFECFLCTEYFTRMLFVIFYDNVRCDYQLKKLVIVHIGDFSSIIEEVHIMKMYLSEC